MKTTSLKLLVAAVLGIAAVSAANAAPTALKATSIIAYDQGGNDPFPPSEDAIPEIRSVIAYHEGGSDPFPTSDDGDAIPETPSTIAYDQSGSDPFPTSDPEPA